MPQDGSSNYQYPPGTPGVPDQTIESEAYNTFLDDLVVNDLNWPRPVHRGGTGASTASEGLVNLSGEKATQLVTNYDAHVWLPGSFRSSNATGQGAPVDGHAFAGIAYINEPLVYPPTNLNVTVEARDQSDTVVPGRLYVREKKAGVWSAWAEQVGSSADLIAVLDPRYLTLRRNRIVNGAMQISQQEGYTSSTAMSATYFYPADQWEINASVSPGTAVAVRVILLTPNSSRDRIRATVGTAKAALAAGDLLQIIHNIEGNDVVDFRWGGGLAEQVILRFGWRSPAGTYSFAIRDGAGSRSYIAEFTISAGQANADTEHTFVIPGDTAGTWSPMDHTKGLTIRWAIATGSTWHGAVGWQAGNFIGTSANTNGMATAGNVFELFDVGLYLDADNAGVPPKWEMPDPTLELYRCQRYYYRKTCAIVNEYLNTAQAYGVSSAFGLALSLPITMRAIPTATISAASHFSGYNSSAVAVAFSTVSIVARSTSSINFIDMAGASGLAVGNATVIAMSTVGGWIQANARM